MESIGIIIKEKRLELGITIETAADETRISRSFLEAIEKEEYDVLPNEAYLLGFLRNYSEYLGLNADEMVKIYKSYKTQLEPTPVAELLTTKKKFPKTAVIIILSLLLAFVVGGAVFGVAKVVLTSLENRSTISVASLESAVSAKIQKMTKDEEVFTFSEGMSLESTIGEVDLIVYVDSVTDKSVMLKIWESQTENFGKLEIGLNEIATYAVQGEEKLLFMEVLMIVEDAETAEIKFTRKLDDGSAVKESVASETDKGFLTVDGVVRNLGETRVEGRKIDATTVLVAAEKESFDIKFAFDKECIIIYSVDNKAYVTKKMSINDAYVISAENIAYISVSNADAFTATVNNEKLDFGKKGSVNTRLLEWKYKNERKQYELEFKPAY